MKTYNRALDYTVLALSQLTKGNSVMAARLMAKAVEQKDIRAAIATLEASNKHAYSLRAKSSTKNRVRASDDFPMDDEDEMDVMDDDMDDGMEENAGFEDGDEPLDEMDDDGMDEDGEEEESPSEAMAKVLSRMVRRSGKR